MLSDYSLKLVRSGAEYFDILAGIIQKAEESIYFQTYIFANDQTGNQIADLLQKASQRGIKVYLLMDAFGSNGLSEAFVANLVAAGIQFRFFSPIQLFRLQVGRRLHQKIVVVDERHALIGGINVADKYAGVQAVAWLDYAVLIEGSVVADCQKLCMQLWKRKYPPSEQKLFQHKTLKLLQHDFMRGKREISKAYQRAIRIAQKEIIIIASYFLPSQKILNLLKKVSQKGVVVRIIVSEHSDVLIFKKATEYLYRELQANNIQIFEYQPSVVHAKAMVVDGHWCTVGSFNLNAISEFGSVELNVEVSEAIFTQKMHQELTNVMEKDCLRVSAYDTKQKSGLWAKFNYGLVRFLIRFFFWLLKKPKSYKTLHE